MKRFNPNIFSSNGFTLIEIIVTIVMMGILAAFFVHFMGTALEQSSNSMELVIGEAEAESIMEEIIAYYTSEINSDPDNALATLVSKKNNGDFGISSNIPMDYITFDAGGNEQPAVTSDNLKVTVKSTGHNLITILTKSRTDSGDPIVNY